MITLPAASEASLMLAQATGMLVRTTRIGEPGDVVGVPNWTITVRKSPKCSPKEIEQWWREAMVNASGTDTLPLLLYRPNGSLQWTAGWPAALFDPDNTYTPGVLMAMRHGNLAAWKAWAEPTFSLVLD